MGCSVISLQYVGDGAYLVGVPARDLMPADLLEVALREGIGLETILASNLYRVVEWVEVAPFCGAPTDEGRCREPVDAWGDRCTLHGGDREGP